MGHIRKFVWLDRKNIEEPAVSNNWSKRKSRLVTARANNRHVIALKGANAPLRSLRKKLELISA